MMRGRLVEVLGWIGIYLLGCVLMALTITIVVALSFSGMRLLKLLGIA